MRLFIPLLAAAVGLAVTPISAIAAEQAIGAADRQADIARVETYLNSLTTAKADFTMVSASGGVSNGIFYLSRPGKLRFEFAEPKGNLLVADGDYIVYWDAKAKEASNERISSTPASFLLKPRISLNDTLRVTGFERGAGVIRITLVEAADPSKGSVTVVFGDQPLELRSWRLTDPQGDSTDVAFSGWKYGLSLEPDLFHFQDPNAGRRGR